MSRAEEKGRVIARRAIAAGKAARRNWRIKGAVEPTTSRGEAKQPGQATAKRGVAAKAAVKKRVAKRAAAKKSVAKKPAAKKSIAKKTTTSRTRARPTTAPERLTLAIDRRHDGAHVPTTAQLRRWVATALAGRREGPTQVQIAILGAREGRALNRRFRGRDYATNVLSFPYTPAVAGLDDSLLGDLALCAPVIAREAREQGKRPVDHYAHLVIHGVLHLLGLDHARPRAARAMEAIEIQLLDGLGISNPYE